MKESIGKTIYRTRTNKGLTQKELTDKNISIGQISNIENGLQTPSVDKFIRILGKLNLKYDEFIFLMNDDYLKSKTMMEKKLAEFVKRQNITGLKKLADEADELFEKYGDIYFQHIGLISLAMSQLIQSNNDYDSAKKYLQPIKDYLDKIDEWSYYELALICQCLFMFDIETAIKFGDRALELIEKKYSFYKNEGVGCVLLTNMAIYALDHSEYYHIALKYAQMSINLAATTNDATRALHAKILHQMACYKLENGLFDENKLFSLVNTFKVLEWHKEHQQVEKFVEKHGISLSTSN